MLWFILFPLNFIVSIICYITNPIVVLFADEVGELHGFLNYWQTWDDSCDNRDFVLEWGPSFIRYDFDSKYTVHKDTTPKLREVGRERWFVSLKEGATFTTKERIQRYLARVLWLTRNCSYGFSFWLFGRKCEGNKFVYPIKEENKIFGYDPNKNILTTTWIYKNDKLLFSVGRYDIYNKHFLGWKIPDELGQAMIAGRIAFKFKKKIENN